MTELITNLIIDDPYRMLECRDYVSSCKMHIIYNMKKTTIKSLIDNICENYLYEIKNTDINLKYNNEHVKSSDSIINDYFAKDSIIFVALNENIKSENIYKKSNSYVSKYKKDEKINNLIHDKIDNKIHKEINGQGYPIYVKALNGYTITLNINSDFTIHDIKLLIQNKLETRVDQIRLIFAGMILEDDQNVTKYNIQKDSTIHQVLRLRGGMFHEISSKNGYHIIKEKILFVDCDIENLKEKN